MFRLATNVIVRVVSGVAFLVDVFNQPKLFGVDDFVGDPINCGFYLYLNIISLWKLYYGYINIAGNGIC